MQGSPPSMASDPQPGVAGGLEEPRAVTSGLSSKSWVIGSLTAADAACRAFGSSCVSSQTVLLAWQLEGARVPPARTSFSKLAVKVGRLPQTPRPGGGGRRGAFLSVELLEPPEEVTGPPPDQLTS